MLRIEKYYRKIILVEGDVIDYDDLAPVDVEDTPLGIENMDEANFEAG